MNHKINQDVLRKHARVPRTYHEATGIRFYSDKKTNFYYEFIILSCIFIMTIGIIFFLSWLFTSFPIGS